jgi:phospholipid transport system substrate-binding protein
VVLGGLISLALVPGGVLEIGTVWAQGTATEAVRGTVNQVIQILSDPDLKKPNKAQERRRLLEKVVGERFSYEEMAKRTLGSHWQKLDEPARAEFVELFKRLLINSYADRVEGYSGEQVSYLNERHEGNYAEVRTKVASGKTEIPLDYRLVNKNGEWRVYDVVVDGVSLVSNYRGQFAKIMRTSGYEELVKQLREKSDQFVKVKTAPGTATEKD